MKRRYITMLAGLYALASAMAQPAENKAATETPATGNWYIEVGGGAQLFFGEDAALLDFGKRLTPSISLTGGRWFNPFWGARFRASGWSLNGFSTSQGLYVGDPTGNGSIFGPNDPVRNEVIVRPDGSYRYYLRYMDVHADLQVSLANLILGYDPQRRWDVIPAVGLGYTQTFAYKGTPAVSSLSAHFSVMGKWKLPKGFDLNMEVFTSVLPDRFDGRITARNYEPALGLSLGVTYNFGRRAEARGKDKATPADATVAAHDPGLLDNVRKIVREEMEGRVIERHFTDTVTVVKEVERPLPATVPVRIASIRFGAGQVKPFAEQDIQFDNIAEFIRTHPEATLLIEGYADNETGSPEYNLQLSEQRAAAVRDALVAKYGVPAERIQVKAYGSDVQVYDTSAWNRVVIIKTME